MTTSTLLSRRPGRALQVASLALLGTLAGCDFEPFAPNAVDYAMAEANHETMQRSDHSAVAAGGEAQILGALEMLVGTPSAPKYLVTEYMVDAEWDPNVPFLVGDEFSDEVRQEIIDDNRTRRFEDQLRLIDAGRYEEVPEPAYAQDLWATWQSDYLPRLLEDPNAPMFDDDAEGGTVQENAKLLFEEWYPTLAESAEMYRVQCMHCHGVDGGGDGPTGEFLSPRPRDYRHGKFKWIDVNRNERPRREDLYEILDYGVPRTAMPSFARFSRGELEGLVDYVRLLSIRGEVESLMVNDFTNSDYGDLPVTSVIENYELVWNRWLSGPTTYKHYEGGDVPRLEDVTPEMIAKGDELFHGADAACSTCHGDLGRGDGESSFEPIDPDGDGETENRKKLDEWGEFLEKAYGDKGALQGDDAEPFASNPRNLQLGNYRGGARPVDLYRRIKYGISGTIMPAASTELTDDDIWALVYYVRSLGDAHDPARIQEARAHGHDHDDDHGGDHAEDGDH